MSGEDDIQREKFTIATHLYVRLRRGGGRPIDVMWMTKDEKYAREVLDMAMASTDAQTLDYAKRYAELMGGPAKKKPTPAPAAPPASIPPATLATPVAVPPEMETAAPSPDRYVRSLR
jgi:hypothetical protein